jgi:hypothetical protein
MGHETMLKFVPVCEYDIHESIVSNRILPCARHIWVQHCFYFLSGFSAIIPKQIRNSVRHIYIYIHYGFICRSSII